MISRRRFIGDFFHGTRRTSRSLSTALDESMDASALSSTTNCRPNVDADDVVADKIAAITFCGISEMLADSRCNESLELGRGHPAHAAGTPRLSVQEG